MTVTATGFQKPLYLREFIRVSRWCYGTVGHSRWSHRVGRHIANSQRNWVWVVVQHNAKNNRYNSLEDVLKGYGELCGPSRVVTKEQVEGQVELVTARVQVPVPLPAY